MGPAELAAEWTQAAELASWVETLGLATQHSQAQLGHPQAYKKLDEYLAHKQTALRTHNSEFLEPMGDKLQADLAAASASATTSETRRVSSREGKRPASAPVSASATASEARRVNIRGGKHPASAPVSAPASAPASAAAASSSADDAVL